MSLQMFILYSCYIRILNGVISVPIMAVMMLMAVRPDIMGRFVISFRLKVLAKYAPPPWQLR